MSDQCVVCALDAEECKTPEVCRPAEERFFALKSRVQQLEEFGEKVNAIRNSIVGAQCFNFSEHAYTLVAALNAAGFKGLPYPEAQKNIRTLLERNRKLVKMLQRIVRWTDATGLTAQWRADADEVLKVEAE